MKRTRSIAGVVLVGAAMFIGGALVPSWAERSQQVVPQSNLDADDALAPALSGSADATIASLTESVEAAPNAKLYAQLGLAYLQKFRSEVDPSSLPLADSALHSSLELQPKDNLEAFVGMASLANARHEFSGSVGWSRRAIDTNPYNASAYGLLGDSLFELGRVKEADAAYQEMVSRRPDVASYVRASYALQYRGEIRPAIEAMELALQAAGPFGETSAWVRHQLGDIYAGRGDIAESARQNRIGMKVAPGYAPPTVGLAEAFIARDRFGEATKIMERAADDLPSLEYLTTLGDLNERLGRHEDAQASYNRVADLLATHRAAGVKPDADFIVFYADHGLRPDAALSEAFAIYEDRPTPKVADALAWMLHSTDRDQHAWRFAREAISSRTRDADMLFHAATIKGAQGHERHSIALMERAVETGGLSLTNESKALEVLRGRG